MGAWLSKVSWATAMGVPDTCSSCLWDIGSEGIYTGVRILACICLARINSKVRTKSFVLGCLWDNHLGIFSAMLCLISYRDICLILI